MSCNSTATFILHRLSGESGADFYLLGSTSKVLEELHRAHLGAHLAAAALPSPPPSCVSAVYLRSPWLVSVLLARLCLDAVVRRPHGRPATGVHDGLYLGVFILPSFFRLAANRQIPLHIPCIHIPCAANGSTGHCRRTIRPGRNQRLQERGPRRI